MVQAARVICVKEVGLCLILPEQPGGFTRVRRAGGLIRGGKVVAHDPGLSVRA